MAIATINPATGETVQTFDPLTAAELEDKLARAAAAARDVPADQRRRPDRLAACGRGRAGPGD